MARLLASVMIAGMLALGLGRPAAAATTWIMASGYPESNFLTQNVMKFIDEVQKNSDLKIELSPNDTLIKLDAIKTAVQRGQVPIGEIRLGVYGNEDPMYILGGLPYIAPNYASAWLLKDLQKPYFDKLFAKNGMRVLFYQVWPGQGFYTKFPVKSVEDFKGKKLRIYSTATQQMGQMLGFQATILPFAEVPQAFSTGLIEALFTSPQTGIDIQAWDNTKYFTYTGAIFSKNAVIVNEKAWSSCRPKDQQAVLEAAKHAEIRGWEMSAATTVAQEKTLADNGMTVDKAPADVVERMKEVGKAMVTTWRKDASPDANAVLNSYLGLQD